MNYKKLLFSFILILLCTGLVFANGKKPEIILENGFYYCLQPNGEKVMIVRELEPWAPNKVKISPDGKYVIYTTANCLGFECEGRDLFCCKIDGTERIFLHKFNDGVEDWIWVTKDNRNFLLVIGAMYGQVRFGLYVLDLEKRKIILSFFPVDSIEKIDGTDCFKITGYKFNKELCIKEFYNLTEPDSSNSQVLVNWGKTKIYLSTERDPIIGAGEIPSAFVCIYRELSPDEKTLYKTTLDSFINGDFLVGGDADFSPDKRKVLFRSSGMRGRYDLEKRKIDFLDIWGEIPLKALWSPQRRYFTLIKTERTGITKILISGMMGETVFTYPRTTEFAPDVKISNLEWSKDEEKLYYSLEQGGVKKDSMFIDLTKIDSR